MTPKTANATTTETFVLQQKDGSILNVVYPYNKEWMMDQQLVTINRNELHQISLLGKGCYSNVYLVTDQHKLKHAMKCLDPSRISSPDELVMAASDLAMEAIMLSTIQAHQHPNIIRLYGVSSSIPSSHSFSEGDKVSEGYFLLLDVLTETLNDRLDRWRKDHANNKNNHCWMNILRLPSIIQHHHQHEQQQVSDNSKMFGRIETAILGIVSGMQYIHAQNIVLRDLKPSNCGFDEDGQIRIFDFGLARTVEDCTAEEVCGSPRYMAPEVMSGLGYTLKADVYSFGVLLFEVCSLDIPFANINKLNYDHKKNNKNCRGTTKWLSSSKNQGTNNGTGNNNNNIRQRLTPSDVIEQFQNLVVEQKIQPGDLDRIPCTKIRQLIQDCWDPNPNSRPSFDDISQCLWKITTL